MTYSYTIFLISNGKRAKKALCPCNCVRASSSGSGSLVKLIVDLRGRSDVFDAETLDDEEKGFRDLRAAGFFSWDGMSCGTHRARGSNPKSFAFMGGVSRDGQS